MSELVYLNEVQDCTNHLIVAAHRFIMLSLYFQSNAAVSAGIALVVIGDASFWGMVSSLMQYLQTSSFIRHADSQGAHEYHE